MPSIKSSKILTETAIRKISRRVTEERLAAADGDGCCRQKEIVRLVGCEILEEYDVGDVGPLLRRTCIPAIVSKLQRSNKSVDKKGNIFRLWGKCKKKVTVRTAGGEIKTRKEWFLVDMTNGPAVLVNRALDEMAKGIVKATKLYMSQIAHTNLVRADSNIAPPYQPDPRISK